MASSTLRDLPPNLPQPRLDPVLLDQILGNLLDNAVKFSGPSGRVAVGAQREGAEVMLWVQDDGPGIPANDLQRVFDPFFRAGRSDRVAAGSGLGLAICRGLAAAMGGADRRGEPGPRRPRHPHDRAVPCMNTPVRTRILVIDDEPQIHRFLGPALEAAGFEPLRADTAAEGLRLAATRKPALVVLDLGLPDMDGQAVIPRLRAFSQVPILVLSARDREEGKVRALDAGADDYVEKPFALAELLARLRAALRRAASASGQDAPVAAVRVGPLEVDFIRRAARLDGDADPLRLMPREWDLLAALAKAGPGRVGHPPPAAVRGLGAGPRRGRAVPPRLHRAPPPQARRRGAADPHGAGCRLPLRRTGVSLLVFVAIGSGGLAVGCPSMRRRCTEESFAGLWAQSGRPRPNLGLRAVAPDRGFPAGDDKPA